MTALFENIGTVQDGMKTLSRAAHRRRRAGRAAAGQVPRGEIRFEHVELRATAARSQRVIDDLTLTIRPARRSAWSAARARASRRWSTCCCASTTWRSGRILIDGQDIAHVTQDSLRAHDRHGDAGHLAAAPLGARQHPLRPARRERRRRSSAAAQRAEAHEFIADARRREGPRAATTRTSASAASSSPAASASASRSRA